MITVELYVQDQLDSRGGGAGSGRVESAGMSEEVERLQKELQSRTDQLETVCLGS